jgi:hypothetical protein
MQPDLANWMLGGGFKSHLCDNPGIPPLYYSFPGISSPMHPQSPRLPSSLQAENSTPGDGIAKRHLPLDSHVPYHIGQEDMVRAPLVYTPPTPGL